MGIGGKRAAPPPFHRQAPSDLKNFASMQEKEVGSGPLRLEQPMRPGRDFFATRAPRRRNPQARFPLEAAKFASVDDRSDDGLERYLFVEVQNMGEYCKLRLAYGTDGEVRNAPWSFAARGKDTRLDWLVGSSDFQLQQEEENRADSAEGKVENDDDDDSDGESRANAADQERAAAFRQVAQAGETGELALDTPGDDVLFQEKDYHPDQPFPQKTSCPRSAKIHYFGNWKSGLRLTWKSFRLELSTVDGETKLYRRNQKDHEEGWERFGEVFEVNVERSGSMIKAARA